MTPARIQYELKLRRITQRQIASECGVSAVMVHKVIRKADIRLSRRIAQAVAAKIGKPLERVFPAYTSSSQSLREPGHSRARAAA